MKYYCNRYEKGCAHKCLITHKKHGNICSHYDSVRASVSQGQLFMESRYGDKFISKLGAKCREQVVKLIFRAGIQRPFCVALICPLFSDGWRLSSLNLLEF